MVSAPQRPSTLNRANSAATNFRLAIYGEALRQIGRLNECYGRFFDAVSRRVQVMLTLLYNLGEGASEEALKPGAGAIAQLAAALMRSDVPRAEHRLVALARLEAFVRYTRVLQVRASAQMVLIIVRRQDLRIVPDPLLDKLGLPHCTMPCSGDA